MKIKIVLIIHSLIIFDANVSAIINGRKAKQADFTYMVSLWYHGCTFYCSGAILDEKHILTAAHCVYDDQTPSSYTIQAGTVSLQPLNSIRIKVAKIHTSGFINADETKLANQCQLAHAHNDVAVLTLETPLTFSANIQPVKRPNLSETLPSFCVLCHLAGWGSTTSEVSDPAITLLFLELRILSGVRCKLAYAEVRAKEFCAAHERNIATSTDGDSGGPVVCRGTIYGVLSAGSANQKYPMIFMNVIKYLDFIEKALED